MKKKINNKKKISLFVRLLFVFVFGYIILFTNVKTSIFALLNDNVELEKNSDLVYYLDISYDGIDKYGISSSDSVKASLNSGVIEVEDKIPNGLIFNGFVTTSNGTIGAYKKSDNTSCHGKVVDDTPNSDGEWNSDNTEYTYHGLHYDANTRIVSFNVDNLQAGCVLTVGIKTLTPSQIDDKETGVVESRRDFYNISSIKEEDVTINSNMTYAYMGTDDVNRYSVTYKYEGSVPENAPSLSEITSYIYGTNVGVLPDVKLEGYCFSGWTSNDVDIENGFFLMPSNNVELVGSFTQLPKYNVSYKIDGEVPMGYVLPLVKEYYVGSEVKLDSLSKGDIVNDYEFLGWEVKGIYVSSSKFNMIDSDVEVIGKFEKVKYKVQYSFYDSVLPENSSNYLPVSKSYSKGEIVKLEDVVSEPEGYKFLGWYYEDEFKMPENDLIVYGEWKKVLGTFKPVIEQTLFTENKSYDPGEEIKFKVVLTNTSDFALKNVLINVDLSKYTVLSDVDFIEESDNYIKFESVDAGSSVDFILSYFVKDSDYGKIQSKIELVGAYAENGYELANGNYSSTVDAKLSKELVETPITDKNVFPIIMMSIIFMFVGIVFVIYGKKKAK